MKQLIVMTASILLGIALFQLIAGPGPGSIYHTAGQLWQQELQLRTVRSERSFL
ncbi:MAG: hypothetical protein HUJ80_03745 [Firmicutes bacterium]|nr:hypothetical protein [Bacillota bacterium]